VTGEGDHFYGAFLCSVEFTKIVQRGVTASVVNKYDFVVIGTVFERGNNGCLEWGNIFRLIVTWDDQG